jgi:sulfopyruvate decarboxylase subunit beta
VYADLERCVVVMIMAPGGGRVAVDRPSANSSISARWAWRRRWDSSIALSRPELKVVVFDGDGSILMNLGGLTTLARYRPRNLVHVVFDNESLLSVGGFPTATSTGSDIAGMAAAAGIPRTSTIREIGEFTGAFRAALAGNELTTIVAKVEAVGPSGYVTDLSLLENRYQFQRYLRDSKKATTPT